MTALSLSTLLLLAAGWGLLAGGRHRRAPAAGEVALSLALGLALAVPVLAWFGLAGWPLARWALVLLLVLLAAAAWVVAERFRYRRPPVPLPRPRPGAPWLRWAARGVLAAAVGVLLVKLALVPVWSWDHFVIWGLKARRMAAAGALDPSFLAAPQLERANPAYPLGLPVAWVLLGLGAVPGAAAFKAAHVLFAGGLLLAVRSTAARLADHRPAGDAAAAFVAASPLLWDSENLGLAETPLAFVAVAAVAALVRALPADPEAPADRRALALAGLLLGFLPWLKSEGLVLALLLAAVGAAWCLGRSAGRTPGRGRDGGVSGLAVRGADRRRRVGDLAALLAPAAAWALAALGYAAVALPQAPGFLAGDWRARLAQRLPRAGEILAAAGRELLAAGWLGAWVLFAAVALAALLLRHRRALPLAAAVTVQLGLYVAVFFVSRFDPLDHVSSALYRVAAALLPLAVLAAAALARPRPARA